MKKIKKAKIKKINYKLIIRTELFILAMCFVIGIFEIYAYVPGVKETVALATTVKTETFTELYFEDYLSLPRGIIPSEKNKFKFTIHNLENTGMDYPYEVYAYVDGEKQIIDQSSVFVKSGTRKTIDEDFIRPFPAKKTEIIVNLISKNQQIDFWVEGI